MSFAAAGAPATMPRERMAIQRLDKTTPNSYLPNGMLMPAQHGNGNRLFLDQDSYELTIGNRLVLPALLNYSVYTTNTNVLTSHCWPKIKLPEGVQQITRTEFTYNVPATTRVPKRGTVRFMSKQTKSLSISITQKGIGSIYEGSALNTPYGPQLIAMDVRAYAESIDQGQAINTAISIVNAAHRAPYLNPATPFARNLTQEIAAELPRWAAAGVNPNAITNELEDMISQNPAFDTVLRPDKMSRYFAGGGGIGTPVDILLYALDLNNEYVVTKSPDKLMAAASVLSGRLQVFDMTQFKLKNTGKSFQPLECINTIGEVYFMYPEDHPGKPGVFRSAILDIYLFDQPRDNFTKVTFVEAAKNARIWGREGYDTDLLEYKEQVATALGLSINESTELSFPLTAAPNPAAPGTFKLTLPRFWGNLSRNFMSVDQISNAVETIVSQARYNSNGGELALHSAHEQIRNLDRLREVIEHEKYRADYWEDVARRNIHRSVVNGSFVGTPTGKGRVASYDTKPVQEWTPNPSGGMDIAADKGASGQFSAPGLKTISETRGHPLASLAEQGYNFASALSSSVMGIVRTSAIFAPSEMPVNLPLNDNVQLVLTALYGPRVPVFLAAPASLIRATMPTSLPSESLDSRNRVALMGLDSSLVADNASARFSTGGFNDIDKQGTQVFALAPAGAKVAFPANTWANMVLRKNLAPVVFENNSRITQWLYAQFVKLVGGKLSSDELKAQVSEVTAIAMMANDGDSGALKIISDAKPTKTELDAVRNKQVTIIPKRDWVINRADEIITARVPAAKGPTEGNMRLYQALVDALQAVEREVGPDGLNDKVVGAGTTLLAKPLSALTESDINGLANVSTNTKAALIKALDEFPVNAVFNGLPAPSVVNARREDAATVAITALDVKKATYYRCPMFFSYALLASIENVSAPWVLPGDVTDKFASHIAPTPGGVLSPDQWNIPHFVYSQHDSRDLVLNNWHDAGIFSRIGILSRAYDDTKRVRSAARGPALYDEDMSDAPSGFDAPRSSGPLMDRIYANIDDDSRRGPRRPREYTPVSAPQPAKLEARFASVFDGPMFDNILEVTSRYADRPVHRLAALAFLNTPMDTIGHIIDMVHSNVRLPLEAWIWRLFSRHLMGSLLVMVSGPESGANYYNGAKYTVSHDGDRDMWHTRAVITTDAVVLKPENHVLIRNVQPRLALGGHDCRWIKNVSDVADDKPLHTRPSMISTFVPEGSHEVHRSPVSFIDKVPGQIIVGNMDYIQPDAKYQHFPGFHYYGYKVYKSLFLDDKSALRNYALMPLPEEINYSGDSKINNHLAFDGFTVRYDYINEYYARDIPGNGHRAPRKLNHPGAKDYLNGSGGLLGEPLPIVSYSLY